MHLAQQPEPKAAVTCTMSFRAAAPAGSPPHATQAAWDAAAAHSPQPFWPPPAPGSEGDLVGAASLEHYEGVAGPGPGGFPPGLGPDLLAASRLVGAQLHSLLRAEYLQRGALHSARSRYWPWRGLRCWGAYMGLGCNGAPRGGSRVHVHGAVVHLRWLMGCSSAPAAPGARANGQCLCSSPSPTCPCLTRCRQLS
jgi:hypothetical protein